MRFQPDQPVQPSWLHRDQGLPQALTEVLKFHWTQKKRFVIWDHHVNPEPLLTSAGIPQGDVLSPLALSTLMFAGLRYVQNWLSGASYYIHGRQEFRMQDRQ